MRFEVRKPGELGVLVFEGDLTISRAEENRDALLEALRTVNRLEYDVEGITSVDLSFLQLLCSAHKTALQMGKEFVQSESSNSEVLSDARKNAGYVRNIGV